MTNSAWCFRSRARARVVIFWKTFLVAYLFWGISIVIVFFPMYVVVKVACSLRANTSAFHRTRKYGKSAHVFQVHVPQRRYTCLHEVRQEATVTIMTRRERCVISKELTVWKRKYIEKPMHLFFFKVRFEHILKDATIKEGEIWMRIDLWRAEMEVSQIIFDYKVLYHMLLDSHRVMHWFALCHGMYVMCVD